MASRYSPSPEQNFEFIGYSSRPTCPKTDVCTSPDCKKRIQELEQELRRVRSVGYDMLKQRGAWQASGRKPAESSLDFNDLFDHEVNDLADGLKTDCGQDEDSARVLAVAEFQSIYKGLRSTIFLKLVQTLAKVFTVGTEEDTNEQLYDITRAYGLLLSASGILDKSVSSDLVAQKTELMKNNFPQVPVDTVQLFTEKSANISWNLLTTVPPLLSLTPPTTYHKEWHEKELWNKDLDVYDLVYYRPVLFMSSEGRVTRKGWVANKPSTTCSPVSCDSITRNLLDQHIEVAKLEYTPPVQTSGEDLATEGKSCKREVCASCCSPVVCGCSLTNLIDNTATSPRSSVGVIQQLPSLPAEADNRVSEEEKHSKYFKQDNHKAPPQMTNNVTKKSTIWPFSQLRY